MGGVMGRRIVAPDQAGPPSARMDRRHPTGQVLDCAMTVAAVILAASPESALADADGSAAVRRIADAAWSGGATADRRGRARSRRIGRGRARGRTGHARRARPQAGGPAAQIARGTRRRAGRDPRHRRGADLAGADDLGRAGDRHLTDRGARDRSGRRSSARPATGTPGWPVLLPLAAAARFDPSPPIAMPPDALDDLVPAGSPSGASSSAIRASRSTGEPRGTSFRPTSGRSSRRPAMFMSGAPPWPRRPTRGRSRDPRSRRTRRPRSRRLTAR